MTVVTRAGILVCIWPPSMLFAQPEGMPSPAPRGNDVPNVTPRTYENEIALPGPDPSLASEPGLAGSKFDAHRSPADSRSLLAACLLAAKSPALASQAMLIGSRPFSVVPVPPWSEILRCCWPLSGCIRRFIQKCCLTSPSLPRPNLWLTARTFPASARAS